MRTILYLAIVALIATSSCSSSDSGSESPADVPQVVDDYINAMTAQDVDAWRETVTDDYIHRRGTYFPETQKRWEDDSYEDDTADPYALRIEFWGSIEYEQIGDPIVTGDGPWYVTIPQRWIEFSEPDNLAWEGNGTYVVVERDGVMKVAAEYFTGTLDLLKD